MAIVNFPRVKIEVAGNSLILDSITDHQNGYYHGDKLEARLPMFGNGQFDDQWWIELGSVPPGSDAAPTPVPVKVWSGEGSASGNVVWATDPLFDGLLLEKDLDRNNGKVTISCVDRTLLLQQYKLYQAYPNKTGAEIINDLVSKVGMTADISGADKIVGALYSKDHMKLQHGDLSKVTTAWDMICFLARESGNVAYVKGTVVYVKPNTPDPSNAFTVIYGSQTVVDGVATWSGQSNVKTLHMKHNLMVAKDITVEVQYFHSKKGKPGRALAGTQRNKTVAGQSNYIYGPYANLTEDQAQAKANALFKELTIHEYTWNFEAPVDFTVRPYQTVLISGLSGKMDRTFYINELTFRIDEDQGAIMTVVAKTHPQQNDTNV